MKKLSPPNKALTGITIDDTIKLEDSFARIISDNIINDKILTYPPYNPIIINFKPNSSDTKGLSVIVDVGEAWKKQFNYIVNEVNKVTKNLTYNMEKNLLSLTQPTTSIPSTDTTKTTTVAPTDDTSSSYKGVSAAQAYGGPVVDTLVTAATNAITEQVKRMKSLMKL